MNKPMTATEAIAERRFIPERDSVIYRQIVDFAKHHEIPLRPQFLEQLASFAIDAEAVIQRKLAIELSRPQPLFFVRGEGRKP